jgi:peptidyl-tRNA hydrolase
MIEVVKNSWQPPAGLDPECRLLCVALNRLPGITTWSSCCGHGRDPYRIWFDVTHLAALEPVISIAKEDTSERWRIISWDSLLAPICFVLEGPQGDYAGAERLAQAIDRWCRPGLRAVVCRVGRADEVRSAHEVARRGEKSDREAG